MQVRAIRGAITVEKNEASDILDATKELLKEISEKNKLLQDDIISVIFTMTTDLDAAYPAVAARQFGWSEVALMCMNEAEVPGSLRMCIRVLIHYNTTLGNKEIKHVYLKGAKGLRPDLSN